MKIPLLLVLFLFLCLCTYSQNSPEFLNGKVSFITTQNVYVKFDNTEGILVGDTLYVTQD